MSGIAGDKAITITTKRLDANTLSQDKRNFVGDNPVYDYTVAIDGKSIATFGAGGHVKITIPYTLKANEDPNGIIVFYIEENGELSVVPTCAYDPVTKTISFIVYHLSQYTFMHVAVSFGDTPQTEWYADAVTFAAARQLFSGTATDVFSPDKPMTRGMFVTVLGRLAQIDVTQYTKNEFTDVKPDKYYAPYIAWANELNIVGGIGDRFSPDLPINREGVAFAISKFAALQGHKLKSVPISYTDESKITDWAASAVMLMQGSGIMKGLPVDDNENGNSELKNDEINDDRKLLYYFNPKGYATRAQVATVLMNYITFVVD